MSDKKTTKDGNKDAQDKKLPPEVIEAYQQAEKDIEADPDLKPDEDNDLDEGELANKEGHP